MRPSLCSRAALFGAVGTSICSTSALNCSFSAIQSTLPEGVSVNFVQYLKENSTFEVPAGDTGFPDSPFGLPALCAVSLQVRSIGNSTFGFGLFLPTTWNDRFLAVGNGVYGGGINWRDMGPGARYGFATMSTDTGHNSSLFDGSWAYRQPDLVENWGHLAMHGSTVAAKAVVAAYYGEDISYSYYAGCSTGGRQGLKEAEFYPEDFDGIIAAASAWWTSHLQPWTVQVGLYNLPTTADHHIPPELFPIVAAEVQRQCDPQDGVQDNIISDPVGCVFHPEELLCTKNATSKCLTSPQIGTLYKIYSDFVSEDQTFLFPHLMLGSEPMWYLLSANEPNPAGTHYVKYFLGFGEDWSYNDFNEDIIALADRLNPGNSTVGFNLSSFQARGGKLLTYHGMSDGLIPAGNTPYFYDQVARTLKPRGVDMDSFFRTFLIPGMGHCSGTFDSFKAPWYIAGPNQAWALTPTVYGVPGFQDKEHDVMRAMMAWVEDDNAPEYLIGTKYVDESDPVEVARQRPLCMYPKQAIYKGTGDTDIADSWECRLGT